MKDEFEVSEPELTREKVYLGIVIFWIVFFLGIAVGGVISTCI